MTLAWVSFFAPRALERKLPEPCPKRKPMAWIMAMRAKDTPTAAVASVLILPT